MPRGRSTVCAEVCVCVCVDCLALCKQARLAACSSIATEVKIFVVQRGTGVCKVFAILQDDSKRKGNAKLNYTHARNGNIYTHFKEA